MTISETTIQIIQNEDWRKAEGIDAGPNETNAGLARRIYAIPCHAPLKIIQIEGYHIWWCSVHHQPRMNCQLAKLKENFLRKLDLLEAELKVMRKDFK